MTRIAVDASMLGSRSGIGRYLEALLPRVMRLASSYDWILYSRDSTAGTPATKLRRDFLPRDAGRILSLFSTQPVWASVDKPTAFWGPAHRLPAWLPASTARVVTIHDLCWREAPASMRPVTRALDRVLMPRALAQADRIIAVSGATRSTLARAYPGLADRLRVVAEACEVLPPPRADRIRRPYVLVVGTVEPRKNLDRLVAAFARTPGESRLVFAGNQGWSPDTPTELARRHGIENRVHWLGAVDDASLATLYRHALLLAMPSLYEGFGLPILESLAHGTPVLYGNNSSMPEVAGNAGWPVDALSVDSIADGLSRLLGDESLRATLAARAKTQAAKFSWDRAARETLAVFEEAIAVRQARRA